jgi:hypothetical protein
MQKWFNLQHHEYEVTEKAKSSGQSGGVEEKAAFRADLEQSEADRLTALFR